MAKKEEESNFMLPIQMFDYENNSIRTFEIEGEVWFVAGDVCKVLGLTHITESLKNLDEADCITTAVRNSREELRKTYIINISGLFDLVFQSRKPNAKQFRRWVTSEVLPSILKTGKYELPSLKGLSEDDKRLLLRDEIKQFNSKLSTTAKQFGAVENYAIFHNSGYIGMYRKGIGELEKKRGLKKGKGLDHMGATEMAANYFRITQTEEKIRAEEPMNEKISNQIHYNIGKRVREIMIELSGIAPENLPVHKDINKIESAKKKEIKEQLNETEIENVNLDIKNDLWKYALVFIHKNGGQITTKDLRSVMSGFFENTELDKINPNKNEPYYYQIIRNLKSNGKKNKTGFISQGYAEDIKGGFKITQKGINFVRNEFREFL